MITMRLSEIGALLMRIDYEQSLLSSQMQRRELANTQAFINRTQDIEVLTKYAYNQLSQLMEQRRWASPVIDLRKK